MVKRQPSAIGLVEQFAREVVAQTGALMNGDSRASHRHALRVDAAFQKLSAMGDHGRDALATLLTYFRPDVRVAAAAYLLRHRTGEAIAVLERATRCKGPIAYDAAEVLEQWKAGSWALDVADDLP